MLNLYPQFILSAVINTILSSYPHCYSQFMSSLLSLTYTLSHWYTRNISMPISSVYRKSPKDNRLRSVCRNRAQFSAGDRTTLTRLPSLAALPSHTPFIKWTEVRHPLSPLPSVLDRSSLQPTHNYPHCYYHFDLLLIGASVRTEGTVCARWRLSTS